MLRPQEMVKKQSRKEITNMAKDPICGMEVDPKKAAAKTDYKGQTYYFCAPGCKTTFEKDPEKYVGSSMGGGHGMCHGEHH